MCVCAFEWVVLEGPSPVRRVKAQYFWSIRLTVVVCFIRSRVKQGSCVTLPIWGHREDKNNEVKAAQTNKNACAQPVPDGTGPH